VKECGGCGRCGKRGEIISSLPLASKHSFNLEPRA
jgi:hypothetical protein